MRYMLSCQTAIGPVYITEAGGAVTGLDFHPPTGAQPAETPLLRRAAEQLAEYFAGTRQVFDLPLYTGGTPFQQAVWKALTEIPYGETRSYGQIAAAVGNPRASRAVGMANNRNPIGIIIPCHRVVGADGRLVGYGGGLPIKKALLELEQAFK